ncbi:hypothetical protein AAFC00_000833 [Neodothiora populina]|uniref:Glycosyl transferase CAP10 domain-containing protein n=1 Tax=Neodothiora populina TaxID=2781224 RepID=A0ABR3PMY5_9PEZI
MLMSSSMRLPGRLTQLLVVAVVLTLVGWLYLTAFGNAALRRIPLVGGLGGSGEHEKEDAAAADVATGETPNAERAWHAIDTLRTKAMAEQQDLLARETHSLHGAAQAYQSRRGRRPPPGFDAWFAFAQQHNATIVEDFFDQIYHDLNPFWAIPALEIRQQAYDFVHRISVRSGNMTKRTDLPEGRPWMDLWGDLVGTIAEHLPDLDMAINVMDESRLIVPWETIDGYMAVERKSRKIMDASQVIGTYSNTSIREGESVPPFDPEFGWGNYWDLAVVGCSPDSPARTTYTAEADYTKFPPLPNTYPERSYQGYVQNWTLTKSPCDNPELQQLHGTFVEPISQSNSKKLFPMFGGSKLPMNNEILLPPAMYWTNDPFYSGGNDHGAKWQEKQNKLIWRGAASGGRNKAENWTRFQRHRFVAMMNGTTVSRVANSSIDSPNIRLPGHGLYNLSAPDLGEWVDTFADAGFAHLLCFPDPNPPHCAYTDAWYAAAKPMAMKEQYAYKYLPDIDGNSFSGRYRGFMGSTSMPIKATIYDEWHDSRLVPWVHFVPMDNTFVDVYGIMEYFLGNEESDKAGHDHVARDIALGGKAWAERVLRREDMQIYVFRLLLEYARICDDERERLGWVDGDEGSV